MKRFSARLAAVLTVMMLLAIMVAAFPGPTLAASRGDPSLQAPAPAWYDCTYVVRPGDTLFSIAVRFRVSVFALAFANGIKNPNLIFSGMVLRVPCQNVPPPPPSNICSYYTVQRGDWLLLIAARFGVPWQSIAALNHISNPSLIFPGMRLAIPCKGAPPPTGRVIVITSPKVGQGVNCPVAVSGYVSVTPFEATLAGFVYDNYGHLIGQGPIHVNAEMGKPGNFTGSIPCTSGGPGLARVVIAELSAKDGSVIVSASVNVALGGP